MPDIGELVRVVARMNYVGSTVLNVYHASPTAFVSEFDTLDDLAGRLDDAHTEINGDIVDELSYTDLAMFNVSTNDDIGLTGWPTLVLGGNILGNGLPPGVAGLVTYATATLKRRGRKFLAGIAETGTDDDSNWTAQVLSDLASYALMTSANFIGVASGVLWRWVVPAAGTALFSGITGANVSSIPAYQRRRKQGVGI